ncbi:MAG: FGGY-family carbohydrate kinase [Acidimicrobiales bacterium]
MPDAELCLSIDLGSGGPKVALVSLDGDVLRHEVRHVVTQFGEDGAATQDAEQWWSMIMESAKRVLAADEGSASRVRAVAVTGMYACTVPVDAEGRATAPCLTWLDTRGGRYARTALGGSFQGYNARKVLPFIRKTGGAPSTAGDDPVGQVLYLMREYPDVVARSRWFMEPIDFLTMRFSGVATATHASRLAWWLTDNRHLDRYSYDERLVASVGLDVSKLPPLVPFGSVVGPVTLDVASALGISRDALVITGVPDLHAAAIGSGAVELYDTHLALSTTSWISCPVAKKKTDVSHSIASIPGLTNDSYAIINSQNTGARALEWLRDVLVSAGERSSFDEMTTLAASSPPGARGVLFTPWLAGERSPMDNKKIRAGFTNLAVTTTTSDLVRAVMEGVAANSAWLFRYVEKFAGRSLSPLRLLGGGAQSTLWCQLYADVLDRDVEQVPEPLVAQLRGAALLASIALERRQLGDVAGLKTGTLFQPSGDAAFYRERSDELVALYRRDREWSKRRPR